jgi:hypothetical protein
MIAKSLDTDALWAPVGLRGAGTRSSCIKEPYKRKNSTGIIKAPFSMVLEMNVEGLELDPAK